MRQRSNPPLTNNAKGEILIMLEELKREVCEANPELPRRGLITYTWGNVNGIDRSAGLSAIKPSGGEYGSLAPDGT